MWWFSRTPKLSEVMDRLERLERDLKALQLEWDDVYDRLRRNMARIVKTHAKLQERETEAETGASIPNQESGASGFLTPRQKLIQQQILKRRANGGSQ